MESMNKTSRGENEMKKSFRIDDNWGTVVVTGFINGENGRIVARITGHGWKENERIAREAAQAWMESAE